MTLLTKENMILIVGVLLLAAPLVAKTAALWIGNFLAKEPKKKDFEISTVVQLMELRNSLDREGAKNASAICRDLVFAIVYGDKKGN